MKKHLLGALSLALIVSGLALAQNQAKPSESSNTLAAGTKPLTVAGKVSNDGKTFVTDIDAEWSVSNADALKGYEGRLATVKCYVDPEHNRLHVVSVKSTEVKYASRQGDSAFRR